MPLQDQTISTLEDFFAAPLAFVRQVAPATMILTTGGTRRRAALAGVPSSSDEYVEVMRQEMIACHELIFRHGVRHIFSGALIESNFDEVTSGFRSKLVAWTEWGMAGPEALADYARLGWQVRLVGAESWPELLPAAAKLEAATPMQPDGPVLWFTVASSVDASWQWMLGKIQAHPTTDRAEAIRKVFGQDVPPATLYLGSGKPQIVSSIAPPLIMGRMECYWRQSLGYALDERTLRTILYDYAYTRQTGQQDKSGRAERAKEYAPLWKDAPVIGLGKRYGPFWYPAPVAEPAMDNDSTPVDSSPRSE
jgi:hypothetical protein